jgi:beta-glucanase (GH16 family)
MRINIDKKYAVTCICIGLIALSVQGCAQNDAPDESYELVWQDEFNYAGSPDSAKWSYDLGDGCPKLCGWGNNELQYYTKSPQNVRVEDGSLIIEAREEEKEGSDYTSTRLLSRDKAAWKYGRLEIRAKLPSGTGTWPAIWMLPENSEYGGWPASGEIDLMEHVGHEPNRVYATVHTEAFNHVKGTQSTDTLRIDDAEEAFHRYALEWTPEKITWLVDGQTYSTFKNRNRTYKEWPFDQPFHLILNIAVGGNWGGRQGVDHTIWPQQMTVDYVRVYQKEKN